MNILRNSLTTAAALAMLVTITGTSVAAPLSAPKFSKAKAFDVLKSLRELAAPAPAVLKARDLFEVRPERGPIVKDTGHTGDAALQNAGGSNLARMLMAPQALEPIIANFEGISNQDNFDLFGFRVNPPDPVGDVGPNHYVEMVNLAFAVYDKQGNLLLGPVDTGTLWANFPVEDCTDPSGDPIVVLRPA